MSTFKIAVDTQGRWGVVGLPKSGIIKIGSILQDIDFDVLEKELKTFYGDRVVLKDYSPPIDNALHDPVLAEPEPKKRRSSRQRTSPTETSAEQSTEE